jgi:hypothetical protein
MSHPNRSKGSRVLTLIGMLCLAFGLMLPRILQPSSTFGVNLLHGIIGLLLGLSISLNLGAFLMSRRQHRCDVS